MVLLSAFRVLFVVGKERFSEIGQSLSISNWGSVFGGQSLLVFCSLDQVIVDCSIHYESLGNAGIVELGIQWSM